MTSTWLPWCAELAFLCCKPRGVTTVPTRGQPEASLPAASLWWLVVASPEI